MNALLSMKIEDRICNAYRLLNNRALFMMNKIQGLQMEAPAAC